MYYPLTPEEWLRACHELKPSEKDVLYYLRTLDPFGQRDLDIGVRDIARKLDMNPSTVSRALKELDHKKWIDMEVTSARVKLHSQNPVRSKAQAVCGEVLSQNNSVVSEQQGTCGKVLSLRNSVVLEQQPGSPHNDLDHQATLEAEIDQPVESLETFAAEDLSDLQFSTDCTRSVLKTLKEQNGAAHSCSVEIDREDLGTLLGWIDAAGIQVNPAIEKTLTALYRSNPTKTAERVRNAISAFHERQATIIQPQAFINAALKRGFTSNGAKQRTAQSRQNASKKTQVPPPNRDLSGLIVLIDLECSRLGITRSDAVQRLAEAFGWEVKPFDALEEEDLTMLHTAMIGWS